MKGSFKGLLIIFSLPLFITSCNEFIESPVTGKKVFLNAPGENLETDKYNLQFWWEFVEDATAYRLQVVQPDFANAASLILDTLVTTNKFSYTLDPGKYEWRVRAENGSSQGFYTSRSFTVFESSLENQRVQVKGPANGVLTNSTAITFKWLSLFGATNYLLQVDTNNFSDEDALVLDQNTRNLEYTLNLNKDKLYQWRVRAEKDAELSKWSALQNFTYDTTPPAQISLVAPANNQVLAKPVNLRWNAVGGATKYELLVLKADAVTAYNATFPMVLNSINYNFNAGDFNETIYWKVRAIDEAGNVGMYSTQQSFIVQ